ncbi:MAG TPA: hypothetical protein PKD64_06980 [Pirellulaceae bacterium]|mgnify:CR=1 FL=1|nr:hypothetical protein [Pirellulaceae bacterium]HMO91927.1 hypothetical protein [Pirellulaceae bacterium]HMP68726.1 hypothetical protein [Pirellulaceae bacterium]
MLEFTEANLVLPLTRHEELAAKIEDMFDGKNPVQTIDVGKIMGRDYGPVKTQLHIAGRAGSNRIRVGAAGRVQSRPTEPSHLVRGQGRHRVDAG